MVRPKYIFSMGQLVKGVPLEVVLNDKVSEPSSMVTEVIDLQSLKAEEPIEVTLLGMVTEIRLVQPLKAEGSIDMTLSPSDSSFMDVLPANQAPT